MFGDDERQRIEIAGVDRRSRELERRPRGPPRISAPRAFCVDRLHEHVPARARVLSRDRQPRFVLGHARREDFVDGLSVEAWNARGERAAGICATIAMMGDERARVALVKLTLERPAGTPRISLALDFAEVLDQSRPAGEPVLAGDDELRVGERDMRVRRRTNLGMPRACSRECIGIAGAQLTKQRLRVLARRARGSGLGGSGRNIRPPFVMARVRVMGPKRGCRSVVTAIASDGTIPARGPDALRWRDSYVGDRDSWRQPSTAVHYSCDLRYLVVSVRAQYLGTPCADWR